MPKKNRPSSRRLIHVQQGLSIVEVMAAATILALIAVGAASFVPTAFRANRDSRELTASTQVLNQVMETFNRLKFDDVRPFPFTTEPVYTSSNPVALIDTTILNANSAISVCLGRDDNNPTQCPTANIKTFPADITLNKKRYRVDLIVYKGKHTHLASIPDEMIERFAMAALPEILMKKGLISLSELLTPPVEAAPAPPAACSPTGVPASVEVGMVATFTGANTYSPSSNVRWTFQDTPNTVSPNLATSPFSATKTWNIPGTYSVTMEAIKSNGTGVTACTGSPFNVTVTAPAPVDFTVTPSLNTFVGVPLSFSVNTTQCPLCNAGNTTWEMPGCSPSTGTGMTTGCSYPTSGTKIVNIKRGGITVGTKNININQATVSISSPNSGATYSMGQMVSFAASCSNCGSNPLYVWNFGDASPAVDGQTASYAYASEGSVTAQVTVKDGAVNPPSTLGIATVPLNIAGGNSASLSVSPSSGLAGPLANASTTNFTFQTSSSGFSGNPNNPTNAAVTYSVWYGDGNPTSGSPDDILIDSTPADTSFPIFTHKYTNCGNYTATIKAEVGSTTAMGITPVNVSSTAAIATSATTITVGGTLSFSGSVEGNGGSNAYSWTFPDDATNQTGQSVSHVFNAVGTHTVTMAVSGGCNPSATSLITVTPDASSNQSFMKKVIVKVAPWSTAPPPADAYIGKAVFLKANND